MTLTRDNIKRGRKVASNIPDTPDTSCAKVINTSPTLRANVPASVAKGARS